MSEVLSDKKLTLYQKETIAGIHYTYWMHVGHYNKIGGKTAACYEALCEKYNMMVDLIANPENQD
jgi:hypothetical protein